MGMIDKLRTPIPLKDLAGALQEGHLRAIGCVPTQEALELAWAMLCHEHGILTGNLYAVWNYNLGNHDATAEDKAAGVDLFETVPEREVGPNGEYKAVHTRPAYADALGGAIGFWNRVFGGFSKAYYAMDSGDPTDFAKALRERGYFTDSVEKYARDMKALMGTYEKYAVTE